MLHDSSLDLRSSSYSPRAINSQALTPRRAPARKMQVNVATKDVGMKPNTTEKELAALKRQVKELAAEKTRLEETLRIKDEFFSGMNHELRTPLNAILGLTEALNEQVMGELNDRQLRLLSGVEQSGRTMLALISDVFDVARADSQQLPLELNSISAEMLNDSVLRLIKPSLYKHGIRIESTVSAEMPFFLGDQRRLKHMLFTLLTTVVQAANKGETIQLEVISSEHDRTIVFKVFNIDTAQMSKSTDQRTQADMTSLATVANTADRHGGSIRVSEVGNGQQYTVTIPWRGLPSGAAVGADSAHLERYKDLRESTDGAQRSDKKLVLSTQPS